MSFPYLYTDGKRAGRPVHIEISAEGLRLVDDMGLLIAFWSYEGLDLVDSTRSTPYRLVHKSFREASITLGDRVLLETLAQICPRIEERTASPVREFLFRLTLLGLAAVCAMWFLTIAVGMLAGPLSEMVPAHWERQLGNQVAKRMTEQTGVCSFSPGVKALDRLMVRIASVVSAPFPLRVQVTDDSRVNAFSVSGGSIIIFRGMIDEAKSAEELAGLLAHEVSHTALRHPVEGMVRSLGISFIISAYLEDLSELAFSSAAFKDKLIALSYSAENEAAADSVSSEILNAAGISTAGLIELFSRLRQGSAGAGSFMARHQQAGRQLEISRIKDGSGAALSPADWAALRNICSEKIMVR